MRIESIILRGIGPFDDVGIEFPQGRDAALADVYLLTGPNGTGKSTVLYALASAIAGGYPLGTDLAYRRMRGANSLFAVRAGPTRCAMTWTSGIAKMPDPFGGTGALRLQNTRAEIAYFGIWPEQIRYPEVASGYRLDTPPLRRPVFSWAAFAYAGMRSVEQVQVTSIQDPTESPFQSSLSFVNTANTQQLADWIANQEFRRLKAKDAGRLDRAEALNQSVRDIESVVGQIIDDPGFAFVTSEEDSNVRVRREGVIIALDLLPDGLKSIVSWVADLLMRLDRIPWADDTPTMKRPFLLLLDEVDIHLHPAWQRKVLPIVQRVFPNAQIIASTHSPFVVASAGDAHIITLAMKGQSSVVEIVETSQIGVSYSAVLRSIFGIESEFDVDTERAFREFHEAKTRLLAGEEGARTDVDRLAGELASRSEEVRELIALELSQLQRQLAPRIAH